MLIFYREEETIFFTYIIQYWQINARKVNQINRRLASGSGLSFAQVGMKGLYERKNSEQRPELNIRARHAQVWVKNIWVKETANASSLIFK